MAEYRAFTLRSQGRINKLPTNALILSDVRDNSVPYTPKMWSAIWDTGATKSCITKRIADDLRLIPVGRTTIGTANGLTVADTYFVNVGLPNGIVVPNVLASCADLGKDIDILIGMDIITLGDFSLTNLNGKTVFSFRIPSVKEVDFIEEYNAEHGRSLT